MGFIESIIDSFKIANNAQNSDTRSNALCKLYMPNKRSFEIHIRFVLISRVVFPSRDTAESFFLSPERPITVNNNPNKHFVLNEMCQRKKVFKEPN